jgi:pimeloyl-ACP methyl ester carboxylesterase
VDNPLKTYLYLHGFCSGPQSAKAKYFQQRFQTVQRPLEVPDLNQPDFSTLTLSRQIAQVEACITGASPVTLLGSSLGGLTAALVAERQPTVERLVLFAPAFDFAQRWFTQMQSEPGATTLKDWQRTGQRSLYHYGEQRERLLHYDFLTDAQRPDYASTALSRPVPTLILHGTQDEVVPLAQSQNYAATRPWVTLISLESDHSLASVISVLWQETRTFLGFA